MIGSASGRSDGPASAAGAALSDALRSRLRELLGPDGLITHRDRLLAYASDALVHLRGHPLAALFPRTTEELADVLRWLSEEGLPFVPRGAGTGLAGGAVAHGEILVCTARMDRILGLWPAERRVRVQPGITPARIGEAVAPHGLRYEPDPSSAAVCTIGGNVALNAGGAHCLKHGVTADHVLRIRAVLPDGACVWLGRGEDGGLDLAGLFLGSEGTFGIAAEIDLRLSPAPPAVSTGLAAFDRIAEAGQAVSDLLSGGSLPVALEMMDRATLRIVEASPDAAGLPEDAGAVLIFEFEGEEEEVRAELERAAHVCRRLGAREVRTAGSEEERARIWRARKGAYGAFGAHAPAVMIQDACVPRTVLADLLPRLEEIAARHGIRLCNVFHAGDGNLHPNLLFDPVDAAEVERVEQTSREILEACVATGGTITGEHGIGLDKLHAMGLVFTKEELEAMRAVRRVFDPAERCNPGKAVPPETVASDPGSDRTGREVDGPERKTGGCAGRAGCKLVFEEPADEDELVRLLKSLPPGMPPVITGAPESPFARQTLERWLGGDSVLERRGAQGLERRGAGAVVVLSTSRLRGVVHYEPADLVISVRAGMPLTELRELLAAEGQWLPTAHGDSLGSPGISGTSAAAALHRLPGTAGGLVAAGRPTARDVAFGDIRRHFLGGRLFSRSGRRYEWGRPVMKHVAGYDVRSLCCGSHGRLGVLTTVSFRLWPRPPRSLVLRLEPESGDPLRSLEAALRARPGDLPPAALTWSDGLWAELRGSEEAVEAGRGRLVRWAARERLTPIPQASPPAGARTPGEPSGPDRSPDTVLLRLSGRRSELPERLRRLRAALGEALRALVVYPLSGVLRASYLAPGSREERGRRVGDLLASLGPVAVAVELGGPAEHAAVAARRQEFARGLEDRLLAALDGVPRVWLADYV